MSKPNINIPAEFAVNGVKTPFSNAKIQNGFDKLSRDVLAGDNLNKFIDDTYKGLNGVLELYEGCVLYDSTVTYTNKSLVFNISNDKIELYHSLQNNNVGNPLTDTDYWKKVNLGGGGSLFDFKWSDHELDDMSWLRADTFSWHDGTVYSNAYNKLVEEIDGITAETETVNGYTITFYRASNGRKICLDNMESTILNLYNSTGIAWYYILDTTNTQFKLPRTKFGFEGLRNNVGDLIEAGLPNITGTNTIRGEAAKSASTTGALYNKIVQSDAAYSGSSSSSWDRATTGFDASRSNSIYGNSTTVQEPATQMYLYFYVGDYTQTAIEQTAGLNSELFNGKADTDLSNTTDTAKVMMSSMGLPSKTYIDLTLGASGSTYTAPANGWFGVYVEIGNGGQARLRNSNNTMGTSSNWFSGGGSNTFLLLPVKKSDTVSYEYGSVYGRNKIYFIYAQGSESEAS